jgi:hypothetical protein
MYLTYGKRAAPVGPPHLELTFSNPRLLAFGGRRASGTHGGPDAFFLPGACAGQGPEGTQMAHEAGRDRHRRARAEPRDEHE